MPKPKSKEELLHLGKTNYQKLMDLIQSVPKKDLEKEFPKGTMNRNIRDVIAHVHHWHFMFLDWYKIGMKGDKPDMPAKGYTWKTLPDLNRKIWEEYQDASLAEVQQAFSKSFKKVRKIIVSHSDQDLFEKKKYHWTGSTSLGAYLISNTSSHYDWAIKQIKKGLK